MKVLLLTSPTFWPQDWPGLSLTARSRSSVALHGAMPVLAPGWGTGSVAERNLLQRHVASALVGKGADSISLIRCWVLCRTPGPAVQETLVKKACRSVLLGGGLPQIEEYYLLHSYCLGGFAHGRCSGVCPERSASFGPTVEDTLGWRSEQVNKDFDEKYPRF